MVSLFKFDKLRFFFYIVFVALYPVVVIRPSSSFLHSVIIMLLF